MVNQGTPDIRHVLILFFFIGLKYMTDVKAPSSPKQRYSMAASLDAERQEMPWTSEHEALLRFWSKASSKKIKYHEQRRRLFTIMHHAIGIPATLLPISLTLMEDSLRGGECGHTLWYTGLLVVSGVLSGVNQFISANKRAHMHSEFSAKFGEFVTDISLVLCKSKAFRSPADVTLERASNVFNHLCESEPS